MGCVLPALNRTGGGLCQGNHPTETHLPGQRAPQAEPPPWTETPLDRAPQAETPRIWDQAAKQEVTSYKNPPGDRMTDTCL